MTTTSCDPLIVQARNERVIALTQAGASAHTIAAILRIAPRSVTRIRRRCGISLAGAAVPLTEGELSTAKRFLEDGASYAEVERTIGRGRDAIERHLPGYTYTREQRNEVLRLAQIERWALR